MDVVWSESADRDLAQIYDYFQSQSPRAARWFIRRIFQGIDALAEMPRMGKVAELGTEQEYRELIIEHYKIYYLLRESQLVVVRIWDTRQNPTKFFIPRS